MKKSPVGYDRSTAQSARVSIILIIEAEYKSINIYNYMESATD